MKNLFLSFLLPSVIFLFCHSKIYGQEPVQQGTASYYHDSLEDEKTASGEIFTQSKWTAAHKTLPFDTWVKVADDEGREVIVRINDRLPAYSSRLIDLTRKAAEDLDMVMAGLRKVTVTPISAKEAWSWVQKHALWKSANLYVLR